MQSLLSNYEEADTYKILKAFPINEMFFAENDGQIRIKTPAKVVIVLAKHY